MPWLSSNSAMSVSSRAQTVGNTNICAASSRVTEREVESLIDGVYSVCCQVALSIRPEINVLSYGVSCMPRC
jgi:hypothetical protein